jgi:hypothetical protein
LGQVRNVLLILAITAGMALATTAITFVFDILPDVANVVVVPKV